jgi:hypothetical protein
MSSGIWQRFTQERIFFHGQAREKISVKLL